VNIFFEKEVLIAMKLALEEAIRNTIEWETFQYGSILVGNLKRNLYKMCTRIL
jgi:hypothetical protein